MGERRSARRRPGASIASVEPLVWQRTWLDEIGAIVAFSAAIFLLLSFLSHVSMRGWSVAGSDARMIIQSSENLLGYAGAVTSTWLVSKLGWCGLVPAAALLALARFLWNLDRSGVASDLSFRSHVVLIAISILGFAVATLSIAALISVAIGREAGGSVGRALSQPLEALLNPFGAGLCAVLFFIISMAAALRTSTLSIVRAGCERLFMAFGIMVSVPVLVFMGMWMIAAWSAQHVPRFLALYRSRAAKTAEASEDEEEVALPPPRRRRNSIVESELPAGQKDDAQEETAAEYAMTEAPDVQPSAEQDEPKNDDFLSQASHVVVSRPVAVHATSERTFVREPDSLAAGKAAGSVEPDPFEHYTPPSLAQLTRGEVQHSVEEDEELLEKSRQIELKLRDFGVLGRVTQVHPGPVITLFEFEPAAGVKVGRIAALQDDLAMSLRASSIRIVAPIPRRGTVGIEVPNKHRDIVRLRDLLESDAFVQADSLLSVALGKDTYGDPVVADIASMPHLLIAGATGTGKSVCINALLLSLLYRARPDELGFIMIDPKILELSLYEGIPHLRVPVVSHPRQAKAVLQWAVDEMNRRYRLMQRFGVRNIDGYNRVARGESDNDETKVPLEEHVVRLTESNVVEDGIATVAEGEEDQSEPRTESRKDVLPKEPLKPLPKIVIVIDELADLMLTSGREVEELITRLAQKARASGIHLIVATQRPSVDVITGLIKANFPARLSFRVSSRVDSRTILDSMGADRLLGRGDMLLMLPGAEALRRIHGAFVSDSEVKRVVDSIKEQAGPRYDERIMRICEKALEDDGDGSDKSGDLIGAEEYDEMYDKAVELVLQKGHASTSMIQRVFRIGYNRAARIIEMMEKEGIVGPMDGAKPREVLLPKPDPAGISGDGTDGLPK